MNPKDINSEQISEAVKKSFYRKQKYPTMLVKELKKALSEIPQEYDDCFLTFSFLVKDYGFDKAGDNKKNFIVGTIPIKCVIRHPDQARVMLCDDQAMEYFCEYCNSTKTSL